MTVLCEQISFSRAGLRLIADVAGPLDGVPVILSHGGGQTRHAWGGALEALARSGFRAYSLDLRGHGDSDWAPDADYRPGAYADDLRAVASELGRRAIWIGASLGGIASLLAVGEAPRVPAIGLVLVDVSARMRQEGISLITEFMNDATNGFSSLDEVANAIAGYQPHRRRRKSLESLTKNVRRREDGRYYWHWDPKMMLGVDPSQLFDARMEGAAANIAVPTALLRGGESELVTAEIAHAFTRLFADGRVIDIPGARHMVAGDENNAFGRALLDLVQTWRTAAYG